MQRIFKYAHIVRYDECNCDRILTPTSFLRYMQEIAALDAEDVQFTGDGYWVVRRTIVSFAAPVYIHTRLELKTYVMGLSRTSSQRGYEAHIAGQLNDDPVIVARTVWVYVDPRGRPMRISERTSQIWLPDGARPLQPKAPFPALPDEEPEIVTTVVRFSDIDPMRHMNNTSMVEALDNAAWRGYAHRGMTPSTTSLTALHYDIDYIDSPYFDDELEIQSWLSPEPTAGQEFTRFQQVIRNGKVMVRAYSRWLWSQGAQV